MSAAKTALLGDILAMVFGTITSLSIGAIILQGIGAIILGILGAAGGFIFNRYLKGLIDKKKDDKA